MSPATRAHRTTPPPEPPAVGLLMAAAAICQVRADRETQPHIARVTEHLYEATEELRQ